MFAEDYHLCLYLSKESKWNDEDNDKIAKIGLR